MSGWPAPSFVFVVSPSPVSLASRPPFTRPGSRTLMVVVCVARLAGRLVTLRRSVCTLLCRMLRLGDGVDDRTLRRTVANHYYHHSTHPCETIWARGGRQRRGNGAATDLSWPGVRTIELLIHVCSLHSCMPLGQNSPSVSMIPNLLTVSDLPCSR